MPPKLRVLFISFLIVFYTGTYSFGQKGKAADHIRDAELAFNSEKLDKAKAELQAAITAQPDNALAHRMLGMVLLKKGDFEEAVAAFSSLFKLNNFYSKCAHYEMGEAYQKLGEFRKAIEKFEYYQKIDAAKFKVDDPKFLRIYESRVEKAIRDCNFALDHSKDAGATEFRAVSLGSTINTPVDEYLPSLSADNKWLLFTRKEKDENIELSRFSNGKWSAPEEPGELNTNQNEGMARFNACGTEIWFAGCQRDDGLGGCDIYRSVFLADGRVMYPNHERGVFNAKSWDSEPAISCDGRTIYYASNRDGGLGGTDIWKCTMRNDGSWTDPENLGPSVNTEGDEEAPFIAPDGVTLYFSSDGREGFGDEDIYRSVWDGSSWSEAVNMGPHINSPGRELGFFLTYDESTAYFGSARAGGAGGMDIYQIKLPEELGPARKTVLLQGLVTDEAKNPLEKAKVKIKQNGKLLVEVLSEADGTFAACVTDNEVYSFTVDKKEYNQEIIADSYHKQEGKTYIPVNITLKRTDGKMPVAIKPARQAGGFIGQGTTTLRYPNSRWDLEDKEAEKVSFLMDQFDPAKPIKINIKSYACEAENVEKNQYLARKRGDAVVDFLKSKGVTEDNIQLEIFVVEKPTNTTGDIRMKVDIYMTQ